MGAEVFYCIVGIVAGFIGNIVVAAAVGPTSSLFGGFGPVRFFSRWWPRRWRRGLDGAWGQVWYVDGTPRYEQQNISPLKLYVLWHFVAGEFIVAEDDGTESQYRLIALEKRGHITGRWFSAGDVGYFGAFQISRPANNGPAKGKWCGFSDREPVVRAGDCEWRKIK